MRIQVESITKTSSATLIVAFHCASGFGKGRWASYAGSPEIGLSYHVELNVDDPLTLGETAIKTTSNPPRISTSQNKTIMHISIEGKDEDGLLYGRLAPDCILMLEQDDDEIDTGDFISISVPSENVQISPF